MCDNVEKSWRHLNFFQHECYLHCRIPRVKPEDGKIRQIEAPWEGKSNGFALLLEALLLQLCSEMTVNAAVRDVRRAESKENELLKGTKNIFDRNRENMTDAQLKYLMEKLEFKGLNLKTVRAFHLRESFQEIYKSEPRDVFISRLDKWYSWAIRRLKPMKEAAKTIKRHWGVIRWYDSRINTGIQEGLNSLIQSAKSKARGFKTFRYFKIVILD